MTFSSRPNKLKSSKAILLHEYNTTTTVASSAPATVIFNSEKEREKMKDRAKREQTKHRCYYCPVAPKLLDSSIPGQNRFVPNRNMLLPRAGAARIPPLPARNLVPLHRLYAAR
jgi:hypothetical protein